MKIGQITHLYRPSIGGIENYVKRLNNYLMDNGHEVTTITTDMSLARNDQEGSQYDAVKYCKTLVAPLRNPFSLELWYEVRELEVDICHFHSPYFLTTLSAANALPVDIPAVMTVHGTIHNKDYQTRMLNKLYYPLAKYIFRRVSYNFVQGENAYDRLTKNYGISEKNVSVLPNGVVSSNYTIPEEELANFRDDVGLTDDRPTVLYVSRLVPEKNPDTFINAISRDLKNADLQAIVVGSGEEEYMRSLRKIADDRIHFLSNLTDTELYSCYNISDIFVFLGTWEGIPTVIIEAMMTGNVVISTSVGEISNYLSEETGTIIRSPPEVSEVGTAIRSYLENMEYCKRIGKTNQKYAEKTFEWKDIANEIENTYETVLNRWWKC